MALIPEKKIREDLSVSARTLRRWVAAGHFPPAVRVGRRQWFWRSADLVLWERKLPKHTTNQRESTKETIQ